MVDVRSVLPVLILCLELTSWAYPAININSCLQALTKDISAPADIASSALETIIFYCFTGYISALTYYLLANFNQDAAIKRFLKKSRLKLFLFVIIVR